MAAQHQYSIPEAFRQFEVHDKTILSQSAQNADASGNDIFTMMIFFMLFEELFASAN